MKLDDIFILPSGYEIEVDKGFYFYPKQGMRWLSTALAAMRPESGGVASSPSAHYREDAIKVCWKHYGNFGSIVK